MGEVEKLWHLYSGSSITFQTTSVHKCSFIASILPKLSRLAAERLSFWSVRCCRLLQCSCFCSVLVFQVALLIGVMWAVSLVFYMFGHILGIGAYTPNLVLVSVLFVFTLNPLRICYYRARFWLLRVLVSQDWKYTDLFLLVYLCLTDYNIRKCHNLTWISGPSCSKDYSIISKPFSSTRLFSFERLTQSSIASLFCSSAFSLHHFIT